jgi:predicted DNA-binding protein
MGRPIIGEEPKDKQIAVRVSETTVKKLKECSEITGKTRVSLIEEMIDDLHDRLKK